MRYDDHPGSSPIPLAVSEPRPASRVRAWAWPSVLAALMVSTSLAVASTVSPWLVPPYLVLMAWILAPARGSRSSADVMDQGAPNAASIELRSTAEPDAEVCPPAVGPAVPDEAPVSPDLDPEPDPVAVKTRRGKGRGRKARSAGVGAAIAEPGGSAATWIRVGPGKFVRVEGPVSGPQVGTVPADPEGEPAGSPAPTSSALEEPEEAAPEEFAAEVSQALEERPALLGVSEPGDEPVPDARGIDVPQSSPSVDEASPRPEPEEEADAPLSDVAPTPELQHDEAETETETETETRVCLDDDDAAVESQSLDEGEAIAEVGDSDGDVDGDEPAEVAAESPPATSEWDDSRWCGSEFAPGDQDIASDALDASRTAESLDEGPHEEPGTVCTPAPRALAVSDASPLATDEATSVSWRARWPRVERGPGVALAGPRPRRSGRAGRASRLAPGFRRRSRRGAGRYRLLCRTFPPRSPPSGAVRPSSSR